ncbi:MAG: hypothetical protein ACUVRX_06040 [Actinomycetota bacterium]
MESARSLGRSEGAVNALQHRALRELGGRPRGTEDGPNRKRRQERE